MLNHTKNTPNDKAYLRCEETGHLHQLLPLNNLGSGSNCNIFINKTDIEERQSRIELKNNQFFIKNIRTDVQVKVNDTTIIEAVLSDGDQIQIGSALYTFSHSPLRQKKIISLKSKNKKWQESLERLEAMAQNSFPVVLIGESGTGKDVITKKIHQYSDRSHEALVSVNCSALSSQLIESELFGHLKGSFTGAETDRKGAFVAADKGTLFLDEIGDLPLDLQPKLLRALENGEIKPVGSDSTKKIDVRIIAATHKPLHKLVEEKKFRQDLYYRLNVLNLNPPSLKERMEDFNDLFYQFAKTYRVRYNFEAIERLKSYDWPGNIRELKNFIIKSSVIYKNQTVTAQHIDRLLSEVPLVTNSLLQKDNIVQLRKKSVLKQNEIDLICKALIEFKGNQRKTAISLGMPTSTLNDRIKSYKIDLDKIKQNRGA